MKNQNLSIVLAIVIGLGLVVACVASVASPTEVEIQAIGRRPLTPYMAYYFADASADTWVILVDLSDRVNYPHVLTNKIILKSLHYAGDLDAAMYWHIQVGVVTAVTTATTDIEWIYGAFKTEDAQFDERWQLPEHGLSLSVVNASLDRVATFETVSTAVITSSTEISTTIGVTGTVEVGDLILFTEEISDTAILNLDMNIGYDTE